MTTHANVKPRFERNSIDCNATLTVISNSNNMNSMFALLFALKYFVMSRSSPYGSWFVLRYGVDCRLARPCYYIGRL